MNTAIRRKIDRNKEIPDSHSNPTLSKGFAVNRASRNNAAAKHPNAETSILNKSLATGGKLT